MVSPIKIFKLCNPYLQRYKVYLIAYIIITLIIGGISILSPYLIGNFIDALVSEEAMESVYRYCMFFAAITMAKLILGYVSSMMYVKMQVRIGYELNKNVLFHVQDMSLSFINRNNTAYLNQTINNDANAVVIFCITFLQNVLTNALTLIATFYISFRMNSVISLMFISFMMLYILIYSYSKKSLFTVSMLFKETQGSFFSSLQEQLQYTRFIKLHSFHKEFRHRLASSFENLFSAAIKNQRISYFFSSADGIVSMIAQILLFLIGSFLIMKGNFTIGMFTIFSAYFNMMLGSARYFFNLGKTYQENLVSYHRLMKILDQPDEKQSNGTLAQVHSIHTAGLCFGYGGDKVLEDVSVHFEKGRIYGIIGANGSGKSTLVDLLAGLYSEERNGLITYNDVDIREINTNELRQKHIGISEQEPILINDTLRYNLCLGSPIPDEDLLHKYIDILNLSDYINGQPEGLDTIIHENNTNLSGGEKQKMSILRVLNKNPEVMIFDEPTSALDIESSIKFMEYLDTIKHNKIIIIITHSQDIQNICETLYYLKDGAVQAVNFMRETTEVPPLHNLLKMNS
ncbi:ABC transporter ATP-binding protein [Paenibacillus sp. GCM10012306]|uniref:ABC transporter ATP-binding protein n=1 Tax=Paenibacillus sp. GCM10012306 TaxID=3317342 RepID=UPI00361FC5C3